MNEIADSVTYDTAILEWLRVGVAQAVGAEFAASLKFETLRDEVCGQIIHRLSAQVLADQLPPERVERTETVTFEAPATWWQAWKAEHPTVWRGWLARRWPVRMREEKRTAILTVDLRRYWTYPEQRFVRAEFGRPVRVATFDASARWAA